MVRNRGIQGKTFKDRVEEKYLLVTQDLHPLVSRSHGTYRSPRQEYQLQRGFHHAQNSSSLPPVETGLLATPCSSCLFLMQSNPKFTRQEVRKLQEAWARDVTTLQPRFSNFPTRNELVLAVEQPVCFSCPHPFCSSC